MLNTILPAYGLPQDSLKVEAFGSGLINHTWKITAPGKAYILQRVNHTIFKEPADIANNISLIADHLKKYHPHYYFIAPLASVNGEEMIYQRGEGFFRMFPFVTGSHSKDVVETTAQAYEAATQFGRFTRLLNGVDINKLKITIPCFHDLTLRYQQFLQALENGNRQRIADSADLIKSLTQHADIVTEYGNIKSNPEFKLRVTHHDTKISNVLFNAEGKGICVIDLDTVMPGYFISDVGDMMRTYLSPVSEEEIDFERIAVRDDFYKAIVRGYYSEMKNELTATEKKYFFYAGTFMIYMQALRFITDYLNDDKYYGAKYPRHNYVRAKNQLVLLERLLVKRDQLEKIILDV
ncbi:phosphotransferase enzyme family protein [Terrimonas pollutisoli]|uniref:phosphotransferase enzyme family protein n=1 Tax=Terrimonas pollutisoli TaxID=3034147 RepID=UPI0023EA937D|nr:aminoglycoside phosphotransferase family protein [Terrimonas sp. H1YJ31]